MSALMSSYGRLPVTMARGRGPELWDTDGRRYLDALSGIAVCSLGHANEAVAEAISAQARELVHTSNLYHVAEQEALGAELCRIAGMDKAFFCNSGAEANEAAIKIARRHGHAKGIGTPSIVVMDTAFHGRTLATISATGNAKLLDGFGPAVQGFVKVPYDDVDAIAALAPDARYGREDVVAVMFEPVQGEGGVHVPAPGYLGAVRELCDRHGWLLILDEIQSGMGRTGEWFAHQHAGVPPDVMTVAKALGNGVPIGACLARGDAAELIRPGSHGTTFGGNPLACRVGLTVIEEIENGGYLERVGELGTRMLEGLRAGLHNRPGVVDVRGSGLMLGVELDRPCGELVARALEAGLLINVTAGNVIRLLPPFVLTDAQADEIVGGVVAEVARFLDETDAPGADAVDAVPAGEGRPDGADAVPAERAAHG